MSDKDNMPDEIVIYIKVIDGIRTEIDYRAQSLNNMIDNYMSEGHVNAISKHTLRLGDYAITNQKMIKTLEDKINSLNEIIAIKDRQIDDLQQTAGISNKNIKLGKIFKKIVKG